MKSICIKFFMLTYKLNILNALCIIVLILLHSPLFETVAMSQHEREGFPERRQGGGTHWTVPEQENHRTDQIIIGSNHQIIVHL